MKSAALLSCALAFVAFPPAARAADAATDAIPAPVVETFDFLPDAVTNGWEASAVTWTSSVAVAGTPIVWTAANARRDIASPDSPPALALQSTSSADKGYLLSGPIPVSVQRVTFQARRVFAARDLATDLYVNGTKVLALRNTAPTGEVETVSVETVDPATGLPFAAPVTLFFSNSLASAGVALDDIALTPYTLFVTFDQPATNSVYAPDEFHSERDFDVTASVLHPGELPEGATITGFWTVTPDFAGATSDPSGECLTLFPFPEDAGKTFTLAYTATLALPVPADAPEGTPAPAFSHTASCTLAVVAEDNPRFLDFEGLSAFEYDTTGEGIVPISERNFLHQNVRTSQDGDPKIGDRSLRIRHQSGVRPAYFASEFDYPDGFGTISFRYANYSSATNNRTMTLVLQACGEDDEDWSDIPDGTLVVTNHTDISDYEFRVAADLPGPHRFRLRSTAGASSALANIDNLTIRPYGSNAPVLLFRGSRDIPAGEDWSACFCYTNPAPGIPYEWEWSVAPALPGLACTTNDAENRLEFSAAARPADDFSTNVLTVAVYAGGVKDQQLSVPLVTRPRYSPPSFRLTVPSTVCTNEVNAYIYTNDVVLCASTNYDYSVVWTAEPPFNGNNTLHHKSRFRVIDIQQTNTTVHLLTAVLTETKTQLSATNSVEITVVPAESPDPPPVDPGTRSLIVAFTADSLTISNLVPGASYAPFALTNLLSPTPVWTAAPTPATTNSTLLLPLPGLPPLSPLFLGVSHTLPE
ncbi:MAG: hypothetical protein IK066_10695 [Kiritimatiellae bacterium]|nr:hypothetical protein [Kiritimatiellia bacterium]